jgi:hypothetical protein
MPGEDKKMSPAHKSGAAEKKEVVAKKDEDQPKGKTMPDADKSKAESGEKAGLAQKRPIIALSGSGTGWALVTPRCLRNA